jgi:hypothetical protein
LELQRHSTVARVDPVGLPGAGVPPLERGFDDIASFFEQVMKEDSERAAKCHQYLAQLSGTQDAGPPAG